VLVACSGKKKRNSTSDTNLLVSVTQLAGIVTKIIEISGIKVIESKSWKGLKPESTARGRKQGNMYMNIFRLIPVQSVVRVISEFLNFTM